MQGEHRGSAGRARVAVGHHRRPGLVTCRDERHSAAAQRVGHVEVAAPHHPERVPDAEPGQHLTDDVGNRGHGAEHARRYPAATGDRETASMIVHRRMPCRHGRHRGHRARRRATWCSTDGGSRRSARARPPTSPARSASTARAAGDARAGEHPPPPLPVDHPRLRHRRHPVRLADHALPGLGRHGRGARARRGRREPRLDGAAPAAPRRTDHHYVFPRGGGDLLGAEIAAARRDRPALPPDPRLDEPRRVARRPAAGRRWSRTTTPSWPRPRTPSRAGTTRPSTRCCGSRSRPARRSRSPPN